MPNRYALIIGNSEYSDTKLARLRTPDSDVNALADVLKNPALGNFDNVEILLNRDSTIARKTISRFFSGKKRDDLLLLYFSGHGVLDDRGRLFLALKDTEHNLLSGTSLPAGFITDEMDNCSSRRQILILDCCHSGAFARGTKGVLGGSVGTSSVFRGNGYGRVILTASDSTQYAWEGDELIGSRQNSVFTHYLIEGIETGQADLDRDGAISIDELYDFVHDSLSNSTSKQTPGKWSFKQQGEIIISKNPFVDAGFAGLPAAGLPETVRHSELIGPSLSAGILKWGLAGGFLTTLLLIYPLYIYLPWLYLKGWVHGSALLAVPFMGLALVPAAWSGWQMGPRAKSGAEAVFLGAQAGSVAASTVYLALAAAAAIIFAFGSVLQYLPMILTDSNLFAIMMTSPPEITLFNNLVYAWVGIQAAGFLLGSLGCLLRLRLADERRAFFNFNLPFDATWWNTIAGGSLSAVLTLTLFGLGYGLLKAGAAGNTQAASFQFQVIDKTFFSSLASLPPLLGLLSILTLGSLSTLGSVPSAPPQQRLIALYAAIAALLPWINPMLGLHRYWMHGVSAWPYMLMVLLCAASSILLLLFSGRLIGKAGWGTLETTSTRSFLASVLVNTFLFVGLAAPGIALIAFAIFAFVQFMSIVQGGSNLDVPHLINLTYGNQILSNLIVLASIWILYALLGLLLKPLLWGFNGLMRLIPSAAHAEMPEAHPSGPASSPESAGPGPADGSQGPEPIKGRDRMVKVAGLILLPLLVLIAWKMSSKPAPPLATPLQTPGFVWTLQAATKPVYATPILPAAGSPNPATMTVGAAFTQLAHASAVSTSTIPPTVTRTATATPITTLTPSGVLLHLDQNTSCREGPAEEYRAIVPLASGLDLPILARSREHKGWWLVLIKLSISRNAVCWIENGTIIGSPRLVPAIIYYTPIPPACAEC